MNPTYDISRWYVVHTHLRQEDRAAMNLKAWGINTFSPKIRELEYRPYSNKPAYVIRPLFPRYIFAHIEISQLHQVQFTRGVYRVVCFGDCPTPVEDGIISEVQSRVGADGCVDIANEIAPLVPGDKVIIENGPMANFRGIFIGKIGAEDRVRILLDTVSYQAHVEVGREVAIKLVQ
jgi:transcriptional antiterminator RfaH